MSTPDRHFELTTTMSVPVRRASAVEAYAQRLEAALRATVAGVPAVGAFFVQADAAARELTIGLRFKIADVADLEDWAGEILEEALERANSDGGTVQHVERETSVLVPA